MISFSLNAESPRRILAIGCHADDIEIGCGGTLLSLAGGPPPQVTWVVLAAHGERADEARSSAAAFLEGLPDAEIVTRTFRDGFMPFAGAEVKEFFESLKPIRPDIVFTHAGHDLHQDHRLVSSLTWNTFRDHLILEYEIPKYDGDLDRPNVFFALSDEVARRKAELLCRYFPSQGGKHWFDEELFLSMMRVRGMEANALSRYAEGFFCRKLNLGV